MLRFAFVLALRRGTSVSILFAGAMLAALAAPLRAFAEGASGGAPDTPPQPPMQPEVVTSQARALFNEGTDDAHRGEWALALRAFERSNALHPHAVTTYNIGYCERALGRYTRARKMFAQALADSAAHGGVELPQDLAEAAKMYLAELEQHIARAIVTVSPEGALMLVDGRPLERAVTDGPRPIVWAGTRDPGPPEAVVASTFELHVDPGAHMFVVSKTGYADSLSPRTFEPGSPSNVIVALPALASEAGAPRSPASPASAAAGAGVEPSAGAPSSLPLYIALGVSAAGVLTGSIAGGLAIGMKNEGVSHYAQAGMAADVSTAGFVLGGVAAAVGAVYWWLSLRSAPTPRMPHAQASASVSVKNDVGLWPRAVSGPGAGIVATF